MMSDDELKPCPFCGLQPDVSTGGSFVSITCPRCGYEFDWARHGGFDWRGEWNARPIEDALTSQVDALTARIAELETKIAENNVESAKHSLAQYSRIAELEAARAVCLAIEKYIMMPTHDQNGNLIDDSNEWDAITAALVKWKERGEG